MIQVEIKIKGVSTIVDASRLEKTEEGLIVNNYNEDFTIDADAEKKEQVEQELQAKLNEANQYLKDTDWYYARKAETGEEVPEEVVSKRVEARQFIKDNV